MTPENRSKFAHGADADNPNLHEHQFYRESQRYQMNTLQSLVDWFDMANRNILRRANLGERCRDSLEYISPFSVRMSSDVRDVQLITNPKAFRYPLIFILSQYSIMPGITAQYKNKPVCVSLAGEMFPLQMNRSHICALEHSSDESSQYHLFPFPGITDRKPMPVYLLFNDQTYSDPQSLFTINHDVFPSEPDIVLPYMIPADYFTNAPRSIHPGIRLLNATTFLQPNDAYHLDKPLIAGITQK